jgi:hypothetical protein
MTTLWNRATYDAATAHDAEAARRTAVARGRDRIIADDAEGVALDAACDAVAGFLTGRGTTPPTTPTPTINAEGYGAWWASFERPQTKPTPPTTPTPTTPTLLETLVADVGVEAAFRIWAMRRTPTPCRPELWDAQRQVADAQEAERDAVAAAKEARLARRAAAADLAEARAKVAVARAAEVRARV